MDKFVIRPPIKLWELSKSDIDKMVLSTIQMPISGITYIPAIINSGEAKELMDFIDASPWSLALSRRVQHYGYVYDYRAKNVDKYLGEFPLHIEHLRKRVSVDLGITDSTGDFDQAIINEYQPGQGISPHTGNEIGNYLY